MRSRKKHLSLQERCDNLQEFCHEMSDHIQDQEHELAQAHEELRYLHEFISYKGLNDEYYFFAENAHEEHDDEHPFPWLTL